MDRITNKQLEILADRMNEVTGSPKEAWTRAKDGTLKANIGNFHISRAYGGACVHRMMSEGGGVTTPISYGHIPRRDLFELMHAWLRGFEEAKSQCSKKAAA